MHKPLSLLLALMLIVSIVPVAAFGEVDVQPQVIESAETDEQSQSTQAAGIPQSQSEVAERGTYGTSDWELMTDGTMIVHPGAPTEFLIVNQPWRSRDVRRLVFVEEEGQKYEGYPNGDFRNLASLTYLDLSGYSLGVSNIAPVFEGCSSLTSLDLSPLDVSKVTNASYMFKDCSSLTAIDLSLFEGIKLTQARSMFEGCSSLTSLDLSPLKKSQPADSRSMFKDCSSLASLDVSPLDVSHLHYAPARMFQGCSSLTSLDLSSFDLSGSCGAAAAQWSAFTKVLTAMFKDCSSLTSLKLPCFDTSEVTDMAGMFRNCSPLTSLDVSFFNTSEVTNMAAMFQGCSSLTSLDVSSFDTSKVTSIQTMFYGCDSLTSLDVSSFETSAATDMGYWFPNSSSLAEITLGEKFKKLWSFPSTTVNDHDDWYSERDERWYTAEEIYKQRLGIADTYRKSEQRSLSRWGQIKSDDVAFVFDGSQKKPRVVITSGEDELEEGVDYDISWPPGMIDVGNYTVTAIGRGDYTGELRFGYDIKPAPIAPIALSAVRYTYDGTAKRPDVTVKAGGGVLAAGRDYSVAWPSDVTTVGKKSVTVTGKGNYTGSMTATYEIMAAPITSFALSTASYVYDGTAKRPAVIVKSNGKTLVAGTDYSVTWPSDISNVGKKTVTVAGKGNYTGSMTATYEIVAASNKPKPDPKPDPKPVTPTPVSTQVMYRLYNPNSGEHFYTSSAPERDNLSRVGWKYEGKGWTAPKTSNTPVYRLYSGTDHHYTPNPSERDMLVRAGWKYEGIGWYSDDAKGVPLYRQFNPNVDPTAPRNNSGSHNYTTSKAEHDNLVSIGWKGEGIGWYGVK